MAATEAIGIVRKGDGNWIAAVALIVPSQSKIDITTTPSQESASRWIIDEAGKAGIAEYNVKVHSIDR